MGGWVGGRVGRTFPLRGSRALGEVVTDLLLFSYFHVLELLLVCWSGWVGGWVGGWVVEWMIQGGRVNHPPTHPPTYQLTRTQRML